MKQIFFLQLIALLCAMGCRTQNHTAANLPDAVSTGKQGDFHIQGIAVDKKNGFIYCSFTDKLIKMDLSGRLVGSVTGFVGHLGDLVFDPQTNKVYGSLEFKNDKIGKGISKELGLENRSSINFYIAVFDAAQIIKPDMNAEDEELLQTVYLKEVVEDYKAKVKLGERLVKHRFGCSGIDGVTLGPAFGSTDDNRYLYVAYGIYGDTTRDDNDYQVLLQYDVANWGRLGKKLSQDNPHHSGPGKPLNKYFVRTGNTRYGIQNLAYDPYTGNFFAAVYRGAKSQFPNYSLFVIDGHRKPETSTMISGDKTMSIETLSLVQKGLKDATTGIRGWNFKWGATGMFPLGQGLFYISHNKKTQDGQQSAMLYKYKWIGNDKQAFELVKPD